MPRRFRFAAALCLLVASAGGLTACGGSDDNGGGGDANELLKATFGDDQNIDSGNLNVALELDAKGLQGISGPIVLKLTGPFESRGKGKLPKLDLGLTLTGSGASFAAGAITTGDKGWLELQGTTFVVDDATFAEFREGYERSAQDSEGESGPTFSSLGIDPVSWLKDAEVAGSEEVGGAQTDRITAGVDVGAFLDDVNTLLGRAGELGEAAQDVPSSLTEQQRKDIEDAVEDARIEVWTGQEDRALRRLRLVIDIDVPEAVRERAGGLSTGTLTFDLAIEELNEPQEIAAPENARPLSELQQLIAGGATGQTGSGSAATTPTAPPAESADYVDCLTKAGNDVAEIQKCAALAGG